MLQHQCLVLFQLNLLHQPVQFENCDNYQNCADHVKQPHEEKHNPPLHRVSGVQIRCKDHKINWNNNHSKAVATPLSSVQHRYRIKSCSVVLPRERPVASIVKSICNNHADVLVEHFCFVKNTEQRARQKEATVQEKHDPKYNQVEASSFFTQNYKHRQEHDNLDGSVRRSLVLDRPG